MTRIRPAVLALCLVAACTLSTDPPPNFQARIQQLEFPWVELRWDSITVPTGTPKDTQVTYRLSRRLPGQSDFVVIADVIDRNPTAPRHTFSYFNARLDESIDPRDTNGRIAPSNRLPEDALIEYQVYAFHPQYGQTNPANVSVRSRIDNASPTSWSTATASVSLVWTDNSMIEEGQTIYRAPADANGRVDYLWNSNGTWNLDLFETIADLPANATSYVDTTAASGQRYLYLVEIWNRTRGMNAFSPIGDTGVGILVP